MVFVLLHHSDCPFQKQAGPARGMGERSHQPVGFKVAFTNQKQAVLIAQVVPFRAVRVMAGAHGVDIHTLHLPDLFQHLFGCSVPAGRIEVLVPVYSPDKKPPAV